MLSSCDALVIGAGIAGASAAYELAGDRQVVLLERESHPGYHSTGRSAAIFLETYGNATVRALTRGSRRFFEEPPPCFGDMALVKPRGALFIAAEANVPALRRHYDAVRQLVDTARWLDAAALHALVPGLAPDRWVAGVHEPDALDLDVHAIHQGYLRGLRERGGRLVTDAEVRSLTREGDVWMVETAAGRFAAPTVVNAAGAWADAVAAMAGVPPVGLSPKRRTAILFDAKRPVDGWPYVGSIDEGFYIKPDAGLLMASPCDETAVPPCDVQPEEIDVATAVARVEDATALAIRTLRHRWAGLRSFVADRTPVVGFGPAGDGFVWIAGQGGYGIQTAPALARACRSLADGAGIPDDLQALGVTAAALSPARAACLH